MERNCHPADSTEWSGQPVAAVAVPDRQTGFPAVADRQMDFQERPAVVRLVAGEVSDLLENAVETSESMGQPFAAEVPVLGLAEQVFVGPVFVGPVFVGPEVDNETYPTVDQRTDPVVRQSWDHRCPVVAIANQSWEPVVRRTLPC